MRRLELGGDGFFCLCSGGECEFGVDTASGVCMTWMVQIQHVALVVVAIIAAWLLFKVVKKIFLALVFVVLVAVIALFVYLRMM